MWVQKDQLAVKVNQLSSIKTQLPYSYYSLPFCRPATIVDSAENLGEVLRGDRIENSLYVVSSTRLGSLNWLVFELTANSDEIPRVAVRDEGAEAVPDRLQNRADPSGGEGFQGEDRRRVPHKHVTISCLH